MKLFYIYSSIILTLNISLAEAQEYKNQINEYLNANLESLNLERKDILIIYFQALIRQHL